MNFFAAISLLAAIGSSTTCKWVCYADDCKGTLTNPIPNGHTWYKKRSMAQQGGCCSMGWYGCDECCDTFPTPQPTIHPTFAQCATIRLSAMTVTHAGNYQVNNLKTTQRSYSRCRLDEATRTITLTRSTTSEKSESYTTTESMTRVWENNISPSVTIVSDEGFTIPFLGWGTGDKTTWSLSASRKWSTTEVNSAVTVISEKTTEFEQTVETQNIYCPANKLCKYVFTESEITADLSWEAEAHCIQENGIEYGEPRKVTGTYQQAENRGYDENHTFEDCPDLHTTHYCKCEHVWTHADTMYRECARPEDYTFDWCFVEANDPDCDYSELPGKIDGKYFDTCDATVGGGSRLEEGGLLTEGEISTVGYSFTAVMLLVASVTFVGALAAAKTCWKPETNDLEPLL